MDLENLTEEELKAEFTALDQALEANPDDPRAHAWRKRLNDFSAKKAGLLISFSTNKESVVKFFQPEPGVMFLTELISSDRSPDLGFALTDADMSSFANVYRHLNPEGKVPAVLTEADKRAEELAPAQMSMELSAGPDSSESIIPSSSEDDLLPKHATSECAHFRDHKACPRGGDSHHVCVCVRETKSVVGAIRPNRGSASACTLVLI